MTLRDEMGRARPAIEGLNAAIRDNPLAAGLIGVGIAWMLLGGSKGVTGIASLGAQGVRAGGGAVGNAARGMANAASRVAAGGLQHVDDAAGSVASIVPDSSLTETVGDAVTGAAQAAGDQWSSLASATRNYGAAIQSRLSDSLERQPLLLGVIGLTIGAGVAASFATTATEGTWMGGSGADVRSRLQDAANQARDRAGEAISAVKQEAEAQGLTPAAAREAVTAVGQKARSVAGAARDTIEESMTRR